MLRGRLARIGGQLIGLSTLVSPAAADDDVFPHYLDVPLTFTQDPMRWQVLLNEARTRTVRVCLLGDSQETCPDGAGYAYVPRLNFEFWRQYGNCPETPLIPHVNTGASPGADAAGWLWRSEGFDNGSASSRVAPVRLPPGGVGRAVTFAPNTAWGWLYLLYHDAHNILSPGIPQLPYLDPHGDIRAEFVTATHPDSGEVIWWARPTEDAPSYDIPPTSAGYLDLDLQTPGPPQFRTGLSGPLEYAGLQYMVVEGTGTSPSAPTDLLGVRFRNLARPEGLVVQSFSRGGLGLASLLSDHAGMGPFLSAQSYDAYVVQLGTNDAFANQSAQQYRDNLQSLISLLRAAHSDPYLPVIVAIDVHRSDGEATHIAQFDQQAGAAWTLAQDDPALLLLNLRRITEEDLGWGPENEGFLHDAVHLTPEGQSLLARTFVQTLRAVAGTVTCADPTRDGVVDVLDVVEVILAWGPCGGTCWSDLTGEGQVDIQDLLQVILNWGPCPPPAPPLGEGGVAGS